jgi:tight adherence protein B
MTLLIIVLLIIVYICMCKYTIIERTILRLKEWDKPKDNISAKLFWSRSGGLTSIEEFSRRKGEFSIRSKELVFPPRYRWASWIASGIGASCLYALEIGWHFISSITLVVFMLSTQIELWFAEKKSLLIEIQLVDAIDIMISCLYASGATTQALRAALIEAKAPLKFQLREVDLRIKLGEDPRLAYYELTKRVPLDSFRLFATTLAVHAEAGGSVAPALVSVGEAIRDRVATARRIQAATALARFTTMILTVVIAFVFLVVWRNDPERMKIFLDTSSGKFLLSGSIFLVGLGIAWQSRLSRLEY